MSEQVLTPDEIAALFEQAAAGRLDDDAPPPRSTRARWLRTIDFTRPTKFTPDQENRLRRAHEGFCRMAMTRLAAEHRIDVELSVIDVAQHTWYNAHRLMPAGGMGAVLDAEPIGTKLLVGCELPLLLGSIERLLGGPMEGEPRERKLTDIDLVLVGRVFDVFVESLSSTWHEMSGVRFASGPVEPLSETAHLQPSSEPTLVLTIEARLGRTSSTLHLLIPHASVAPVSATYSRSAEDEGPEDPGSAAALRAGLGEIDVTMRAEVGSRILTLQDALALAPGDVVALGVPADGEVALYADDVVVHRGRAGRSGRRRAVQILPDQEHRS
jgi:flagellar motor switch protein FliM